MNLQVGSPGTLKPQGSQRYQLRRNQGGGVVWGAGSRATQACEAMGLGVKDYDLRFRKTTRSRLACNPHWTRGGGTLWNPFIYLSNLISALNPEALSPEP